jgi:hypothetical protein
VHVTVPEYAPVVSTFALFELAPRSEHGTDAALQSDQDEADDDDDDEEENEADAEVDDDDEEEDEDDDEDEEEEEEEEKAKGGGSSRAVEPLKKKHKVLTCTAVTASSFSSASLHVEMQRTSTELAVDRCNSHVTCVTAKAWQHSMMSLAMCRLPAKRLTLERVEMMRCSALCASSRTLYAFVVECCSYEKCKIHDRRVCYARVIPMSKSSRDCQEMKSTARTSSREVGYIAATVKLRYQEAVREEPAELKLAAMHYRVVAWAHPTSTIRRFVYVL